MKMVYSHFPIQLKLQGNRLEIANFLGEKKARFARIETGVTAKIANDEVLLTGSIANWSGPRQRTLSMQPTSAIVTRGSSRMASILCRGADIDDQ